MKAALNSMLIRLGLAALLALAIAATSCRSLVYEQGYLVGNIERPDN